MTQSNPTAREALSASRVTKVFGTHRALDDVTLSVLPGEILCLVGENGAGKSTLGKIFAGYQSATSGELYLNGEKLPTLSPRRALDLGIAMVSQEADVVTSVSVAENVFLGQEPTRGGLIDWATMRSQTQELASDLGVDLDPNAIVAGLSPAGKQLVQILRAIRTNASYMVFDEPTASLGAQEKANLLSLIRQLASHGVAIVYVSHFLDEVFEIGDRAAVLKDGRLVGVEYISELSSDKLIRMMVGRDPESFYKRSDEAIAGDIALRIEGYSGGDVRDVSLEVRAGEVLGFGGLVGSGRTELAELLFGVGKRSSGRLLLDGEDVTPTSPAHAISSGICMLTEDRAYTGLLKGASTLVNVAIAHSERLGFLLKGEKPLVKSLVDKLNVVPPDISVDVASLSGGNQQKTLLARWLAVDNGRVFILDEPTKGVDVGAKHEIYALIRGLAEVGNIVILISSDLPELISLSDRIAVMRDGRVTAVIEAADASEESLVKEFVNVSVN